MKKHLFSKIPSLYFYIVIDVYAVWFSILFSYKAYRLLDIGENVIYQKIEIIPLGFICSLFTASILSITGTYKNNSGILNSNELKNTIKGTSISFLLLALFFYFGKLHFSRYVVLFSFLLSVFLLTMEKIIIYYYNPFQSLIDSRKKILIYGAGELGTILFRNIIDSPRLNLKPIGFIDDDPHKIGTRIKSSGFSDRMIEIPVLGNFKNIEKHVTQKNIHSVYFAISDMKESEILQKIILLKKMGVTVSFIPNLHKLFVHQVQIEQIGQLPLVSERIDNHIRLQWIIKKIFDMLVCFFLLVLLSPLFAFIAALIKADSKGPVFFKQVRIGIRGRRFKMYKFRSMYVDANPYAVNPTESTDMRITGTGKFLRRTSLDELPQLLNVLKGEMSLVGPRPEMEFIVKEYNDVHKERLKVKPGITGLWQLSGDRNMAIHENMEYDLYYVRNWSFFLDIAILIKTAIFAFKGL